MSRYDDMLDLPRPAMPRAKPLTGAERAAQFSPFAALAGYEADGRLAGFIGTAGGNIEMLFVDNDCRGRGIGRRLVRYAVGVQGADRVDVNEQNAQAVGFYAHLGFRLASRSETDAEGKPYPILHLRLEPGAAAAGAEY